MIKLKTKKSSRLKSKRKIIVFWIGLFLFILWMIWGNTTIQVSHFTMKSDDLPEEFNDFKIAHLSDLHNRNWGQALIKPLQEEKPDIIVITGDLIDSQKTDLDIALEFVNQARGIAPVYFVTGNQEAVSDQYVMLERSLSELGVTILDDEATLIENGAAILLMGVKDPYFLLDIHPLAESPSLIEGYIDEMTTDYDGFTILLSHRPELFDTYVRNDVDLVLSGHAHGGQFRLPFIGGVFAPDQGFFPKYTTGVYEKNKTSMVVSRGIGNSAIPVRFNNRPELIFVHLKHDE